jgi:outer membrane receptor protein involved in Fe transport
MKNIKSILMIISLMLLSAGVINAQAIGVNSDTTGVKVQKSDTQLQNREQAQAQSQNQEMARKEAQVKNQKGNSSGVKQVRGARPDWSKAKGARPASIERPSGSRIPKGVGKPGGAKGAGKR